MICPACRKDHDRVVETDHTYDGDEVVRRRTCKACGFAWFTRELYADKLPGRIPRTPRKVGLRTARETPHI